MPYDSTKPADNSDIVSAEMLAQLQALHSDIQQREPLGSVGGAISGTANNPTNVPTLSEQGIYFGDSEKQQLASKIDELIMALRR